jgi:two-component system CheB/CheR fusion protein
MKAHILIVEDNQAVLNATSMLLRAQGYRVTTAMSLAEAIDQTNANPDLDLVITDYHLANGANGKQVICALRELRGPTFKAIVMTGDTSSAVHAFDGDGHLCWLSKPMKPAVLLSVLQNFAPAA